MSATADEVPRLPERLRLLAHLFGAAMILTWCVGMGPYPFAFGVILTSAVAVTASTLTLVTGHGKPQTLFLRVVMGAGGVLALLSLMSALASLLIAPELVQRSQCERVAITSQAVAQCDRDFMTAIEARLPITLPR